MVERTYQRNSLTQTQAEHVRKVLNDVFDQLEGSSEDERKRLTAQRDKLEAERLKLVQAHYTDAIPLDLLKSEQDRIRASLDQITTRLDNLTDTYAEARTGLDQLTEPLVDLDDPYNKRAPADRRILHRAQFTRITIDHEENATYTPEQTTASVLAHTSIDAPAHVTAETKLPRHQAGQVSIFSSYVELTGLEPVTPCLQSRNRRLDNLGHLSVSAGAGPIRVMVIYGILWRDVALLRTGCVPESGREDAKRPPTSRKVSGPRKERSQEESLTPRVSGLFSLSLSHGDYPVL